MSIYAELVKAAASVKFRTQQEHEPVTEYLSRLVLAINIIPEGEWLSLSAEALAWCNAAAAKINAGESVDECPGFGDAQRSYIGDDGTLWTIADKYDVEEQEVSSEVQPENIALDTLSAIPVPEGVQPTGMHVATGFLPYLEGERDVDALHRLAESGVRNPNKSIIFVADDEPLTEGTGYSFSGSTVTLTPTLGKTDAIRALVMQHPEWTHEQLKAAVGGDVTRATLNTVRSVTLATIAVAKRLGLWRAA